MNNPTSFIPPHPLNTAVLFLVFNRLTPTKQVFEAIRRAKPPRLYIAADGARDGKEGEVGKVNAVRKFVIESIDWDCEVKTLFREKNLGCKYAVSEAITWFFENEQQGIVLEDDCLPSQSFFWYCEELLEKYKYDERIFLISGYNKQGKWLRGGGSYFFSCYGGIWGWAGWSRAWKHYDVDMKDIDDFIRNNNFVNLLGRAQGRIRQEVIYNSIIKKKMNTWDYQWAYARHKNNGLACVPVENLIENIGFGEDATHTLGENENNIKSCEIEFPLVDNNFFVPDREYDEKFLHDQSFFERLGRKLKRILS